MSLPVDTSLHDECQWCGSGRLVVPDDDRCRCCIEDGIGAQARWGKSDWDAFYADMENDERRTA